METNSTEECEPSKAALVAVLPSFLSIEFLLGLPGNAVALWIFCCRLPDSLPNTVFLLNMVMADILLLFGLPFQIDYFKRCDHWVFGAPLCNTTLFMMAVNRSASIAFMLIIAFNRYFKIVHPHHRVNALTVGHARLVSLVAWITVVSLRLPLLNNTLWWHENNATRCQSFGIKDPLPMGIKLHYAFHMLEFLLPFLMLLFCSLRIIYVLRHRRMDRVKRVRRAIGVVLVIVAIFIVCFLPGFVTSVAVLLLKVHSPASPAFELAAVLFRFSVTFTYLNSVLDPVIYCFSSSSFHNALKSSFNSLGFAQLQLSHRGSTVSED